MMCQKNSSSPCAGCVRVSNPDACENKHCKVWKKWFLRQWAAIHAYGLQHGVKQKGKNDEVEK